MDINGSAEQPVTQKCSRGGQTCSQCQTGQMKQGTLTQSELRMAVQLALDLGWGWGSVPAEIIEAVVRRLPDTPGVSEIADTIQKYMLGAIRRLDKKVARQRHVKALSLLEEFSARQSALKLTTKRP